MCGTDWRSYEILYSWVNNDTIVSMFSYIEPGYVLYMFLFKLLNVSFWPFAILTKIATYMIFIRTIEKYAPPRLLFYILGFFVALQGYFLWIDFPMRNIIAISSALIAF